MESYFKFIRIFPRLIFGGIFLASITYIVIGPSTLVNSFIYSNQPHELGNFLPGLIIILILFLVSTLGIFVLDCIVGSIGWLCSSLLWRRPLEHTLRTVHLSGLICPLNVLSIDFIKDNKSEIMEYFMLKSRGNLPELPDDCVGGYFQHVGNYIDSLSYKSNLFDFAFNHSVTQEQELLVRMKNSVSDLYFFFLSSIACTYVLLGQHAVAISQKSFLVIMFIEVFFLVPLITNARRRFSRHLALVYLDVFTLGEGATVADREASIG